MTETRTPREAEEALAAAVATGDEAHIADVLAGIDRSLLEFTGRCYSQAIASGLADTAVLFGRSGFHLNVLDEPAVQESLCATDERVRGLREFMAEYAYCRAQRTYYLPVVQAPGSIGPLRALLSAGVGLSAHDRAELLSLAVRGDDVELARALVDGGCELADDIHAAAPSDLQDKSEMTRNKRTTPWVDALSPRSSLAMIRFILEQVDGDVCPIPRSWFLLYHRNPDFAQQLAAIAERAAADACEDVEATLVTLAGAGCNDALRHVLEWSVPDAALDAALDAARRAGHVESASLLLAKKNDQATGLAPLVL